MELFKFTNYRTRRFVQKTFENQGDYYIVADLVRADKPTKIIDVIVYWGSEEEELVRKFEEENIPLPKIFDNPFYGEYVDVPQDLPLLRFYTDDDVYRGLCENEKVGTYVCNPDGSLRIFRSIRVFSIINPAYIRINNHPITKNFTVPNIPKYLHMWEPEYRAEYKKRYYYVEVNNNNYM